MNERIRELKQQATIEHPIGHGIVKYEFSPELFAELIVRDIHAYVDGMDTAQVISNGILRRYELEE
jgi:hypothetical protein